MNTPSPTPPDPQIRFQGRNLSRSQALQELKNLQADLSSRQRILAMLQLIKDPIAQERCSMCADAIKDIEHQINSLSGALR